MQTKGAGKVSRQLVVGIDAMEWSLVQKWANEGKLPTFRRLIEQGARAELTTTAAPATHRAGDNRARPCSGGTGGIGLGFGGFASSLIGYSKARLT